MYLAQSSTICVVLVDTETIAKETEELVYCCFTLLILPSCFVFCRANNTGSD